MKTENCAPSNSSGPSTGTGKGCDGEVPGNGRAGVSLRSIALAALALPLLQGQAKARQQEAEERWLLSHVESVRTYLEERFGEEGFSSVDAAGGSSLAKAPDTVSGTTLCEPMPSSGGTGAESDSVGFSNLMDARHLLYALRLLKLNPTGEDRKLSTPAGRLKLESAEILAVSLALGVESDPWVGRAVAWLQTPVGGSRPTLGLLNTAFAPFLPPGRASVAAVIAAGSAVRTGLLQVVDEGLPLPEQSLRVCRELALFLMGEAVSWPGEVTLPSVPLPGSLKDAALCHAAALLEKPDRTLIVRCGSRSEGGAVAGFIAHALGKAPLFLHADKAATAGLAAFCFAGSYIPVFLLQGVPGEQQVLPNVAGYDSPVIAVVEGDGAVISSRAPAFEWLVPVPSAEERRNLWVEHVGEGALAAELAEGHLHGPGRIAELAAVAGHAAALRGSGGICREDVTSAACCGDGAQLGSLARPVTDLIPDEALVLPNSLRDELKLLLARCRGREGLSRGLGAAISCRYRLGVRSLFVGPSGTGKTLAASWVATKLGMPLYAVDLAGVTSKYIGETEKNLSLLLSRAENADVILLFDEADSLFGKRTDVRDANDRFANSQTNYLLQRIESYRGIVILTSNSRNRFDSAFTRRIDAIIEFPLPSPEERRELWRTHLGDRHSITEGELNRVAVADLCGGHIRNAALHAAVRSGMEGQGIALRHVVEGIAVEFKKLGKMMPGGLAGGME